MRKLKVTHFNRLKPYLARSTQQENQPIPVISSLTVNSTLSSPRPHPYTNLHIMDEMKQGKKI